MMRTNLSILAIALFVLIPTLAVAQFPEGAQASPEFQRFQKKAQAKLLSLDPAALAELFPIALEAYEIHLRASQREEKHRKALAAKGLAEVPPCASERYTPDTGGFLKSLSFNKYGEIYVDRRFITKSEMKTVRRLEAWFRKWFPDKTVKRKKQAAKKEGKQSVGAVPVFSGFEDERYQAHDALIVKLVKEFNADKMSACGGTQQQAVKIPELNAALVKSHMIEESGGNGPRSIAAWKVDPLQVNVPGDWGDEKKLVGLNKPEKRNEGSLETNIRAALRYLSRKGFGTSAKPAAETPKSKFSGWLSALRRYNGRRDRTETDRYYSDEYADKIMKRANNPSMFVPIEIKLAPKNTSDAESAKK